MWCDSQGIRHKCTVHYTWQYNINCIISTVFIFKGSWSLSIKHRFMPLLTCTNTVYSDESITCSLTAFQSFLLPVSYITSCSYCLQLNIFRRLETEQWGSQKHLEPLQDFFAATSGAPRFIRALGVMGPLLWSICNLAPPEPDVL